MRKLTLLLLVLLTWLQYSLWLGKHGVRDFIRIKNDVLERQRNNVQLKIRNERLFAEINALLTEEEVIEERARSELGMIKADENFYRLVIP